MKGKFLLLFSLIVPSMLWAQYDVEGNYKIGGYVGIGTETPNLPLEIYSGDFTHLRLNRSNAFAIDIKMGTSHHLVFQGVYSDPMFQFRNMAGDTKIQLHTKGSTYFNSGNVGIGTKNPYLPLEIYSEEFNHLRLNRSNTAAIDLKMGSGHHLVFQGVYDDPYFHFRNVAGDTKIQLHTNGNTYFNSGNVGIGSGDPKEKLEVEGTGRFVTTNTGLNYLIKIGSNTHHKGNAAGIGFDPEGYNDAYLNRIKTAIVVEGDGSGWSRGNLHILQANNSENIPATLSDAVFTIDRYGKVGIGTTTPKNKLSVNGTIWAKEVKVTLADAADWVFEDDYKLRSLNEVETFVKDNKHLPDVPSADEFRENDMNIAKMNNVLLQKVEELTLYLIEQNKLNQAQQQKIEELEKKLNSLEKK